MSSETPDIETFIFVQDNITKYNLSIDITSQALKNKLACLGRKYISKDGTKKKVRPEELDKYLEQGWKLGQKH